MRTRLDSRGRPVRNAGQVLLIFAAALLAILGLAALGIDVGYLYSARHDLQRSADAGALAGASAFLEGDWAHAPTQAASRNRARDFATRESVVAAALAPGEVGVSFPSRDRVRVDTSRTVGLFFSRLFLGPTRLVTASATAEASVVDTSIKRLKPWGIPYPWEDLDGDGLYDPGEPVHRDCPEGGTDPAFYFCQGTRVILKIGTPPHNPHAPEGIPSIQQESGHFFALALEGTGGSSYSDTIVSGAATGYSLNDALTLEPGNKVGPTRQGVADLIAGDEASAWNAELNLPDSGAYPAADSGWMNSPRVVRIPIYDPEVAIAQGRSEMIVAGFAGFWIESVSSQGTIIGRFVPMSAEGTGGPSSGPSAGPLLRILRLVE